MTTDHGFTEQESRVIFGICAGLKNEEIAERYQIGADAVRNAILSIFDKVGVSTRMELLVFVMDTLNKELRWRSGAS